MKKIVFNLINCQTGDIVINIHANNRTDLKNQFLKLSKSLEIDCKINIDVNDITIINNEGAYVATAIFIDFKNNCFEEFNIHYSDN